MRFFHPSTCNIILIFLDLKKGKQHHFCIQCSLCHLVTGLERRCKVMIFLDLKLLISTNTLEFRDIIFYHWHYCYRREMELKILSCECNILLRFHTGQIKAVISVTWGDVQTDLWQQGPLGYQTWCQMLIFPNAGGMQLVLQAHTSLHDNPTSNQQDRTACVFNATRIYEGWDYGPNQFLLLSIVLY